MCDYNVGRRISLGLKWNTLKRVFRYNRFTQIRIVLNLALAAVCLISFCDGTELIVISFLAEILNE